MNYKIKINNKITYTNIIFKKNYIKKYLKTLLSKNDKIYCVVDLKLKKHFKDLSKNNHFKFIFLKSGEKIKSLEKFKFVSEKLLSQNIDRQSTLVSIGGGTLGDLCGFISSTILRGIDFKLIPTTLLSQVDSSIGGKNGINVKNGKNMIGTFYNPSEVIIDTSILTSLPLREIKSGYAEIVKHSLIKDKIFFNWLEKNYKHIFNMDLDIIEKAVYRSIKIKLHYVQKDPYENLKNYNSRSILNFGHTVGHALEAFYSYNKKMNHGEAICIGIIAEAIISNKLGYLTETKFTKILNHFKDAKLKIWDKNLKNNKILSIMKKDKKNFHNKLNIVLLNDIGSSFFYQNIEIDIVKKIIKEFR